MLTYNLKKSPSQPLYEALYRAIVADIRSGALAPGEKLPSKRALAQHLNVSKITVENAYEQLLSEGYIRSREKVGYFVESVPSASAVQPLSAMETDTPHPPLDLTANGPAKFPFSVWMRLQREVIRDKGDTLLQSVPNQGDAQLRQAIAAHLARFRGMAVSADHIIVGAGTDFLYNLLIQLLGRQIPYALEEPGYGKIRRIYTAGGVQCVDAPMDAGGVLPQVLSGARVLHISPEHHFPTGIVMPTRRRLELLDRANVTGSYLIEDDYDSEFRFLSRPQPPLYSLSKEGRVIYMNSFSKSLAPSIRISYMVLPSDLMALYREKLGFYSCTVPAFEQHTLARFLQQGHFERHINRMRKFYRSRRDRVLDAINRCSWAKDVRIEEENAGLHFLLRLRSDLPDGRVKEIFTEAGIKVQMLSEFYHGPVPESARHVLVVNYSGLEESELYRLERVKLPE